MNQTWENGEEPKLGPDFDLFGPNLEPQVFFSWVIPRLYVKHCCKLSLYAISRKTQDPNSIKWRKNLFWAWFRTVGPKFRPPFFFSKLRLRQSLDIMVNYCHVKCQRKLMIQSWENLVTDRQTDKRTRVIS